MSAPKLRKWGVHTIIVESPAKYPEHVSWRYKPNDYAGGYVDVSGKHGDFVYVSTDEYEGTAVFPSALIPEVIRRLRAILKSEGQQGGSQ